MATETRVADFVDAISQARSQVGKHERPQLPSFRITGLERWEGRIIALDHEMFTAELVPAEPDALTVYADFQRGLLEPEEDVTVGDIVYVTVRSVVGRTGLREMTSTVRLRRLGIWSDDELAAVQSRARAQAQELAKLTD